MKKLILIPALLGTLAMASDYNYEISPVIGYNIAEGNLNLDNEIISGLEAQYNGFDFPIKPEISILHSGGVNSEDTTPSNSTNITRFALNGVYDLMDSDTVIPFIKAGVGYETLSREVAENTDGMFVDAGAGVKIPFTDSIALKLEALYMLKYNKHTTDDKWGDSNLALLAGINFAFGPKAQPVPLVVDGDDDNDGVLNSIDLCPTTPTGKTVDATGCCVDGDDDNDGVLNSIDECPTTPAGRTVLPTGCCDGDDDKDGVLNSVDKCPNTHPNVTKVDVDGCAVDVNLHVNFKFDSFEVTEDSHTHIKDFGNFMNDHDNYSATIEGHTDSSGPAVYNQALSEKRAKIVTDLIVSEGGVSADRLTTTAKGETSPVATNDTKEGRAENRRTEAHIIKN